MESISTIFSSRVAKHPQAIAIKYRDQAITYESLNNEANRLATALCDQGVEPHDIISISMDRTPKLIIGLLAILKVGAAYLPINIEWPVKRIETVVELAKSNFLLIGPGSDNFTLDCINIINLNDSSMFEGSSVEVSSPSNADDLAYINFTSGSSGTPKGVMIPHKGVVSLLFKANYVPLSEKTITLQLSTPSFDAMTFELWAPLLHGGTCVLYDGNFPQLSRLKHTIRTNNVNTVFLTTALFNIIIDESPSVLKSVKYVLTGGEAHSISHILKSRAILPQVLISSVYGPTEATTFSTHFPINNLKKDATTIPLGKPTNNRNVIVVDDDMAECPSGKKGEIYISGMGLADGYLGRLDLTELYFVSLSFNGNPSQRFYKTGDIGRYDNLGNIEFHGRKDNQIKLSGYRIELGEIESVLVSHNKVQRAVVLIVKKNTVKQLHAVVVAANEIADELSHYLSERLPAYILPSTFQIVDSLPMTATGKIDRNRLTECFER